MRVRLPFVAAFIVLLAISAYFGLAPIQIPTYYQSDKGLHFLTFFLLTLTFYWGFETSRRRALHITLLTCTAVLGVGSEILQGIIRNGRSFDLFDVVANVIGSLTAVGLCTWYHRRMLERKRAAKGFHTVSGDEEGDHIRESDLELGENIGLTSQETGVTSAGQRESNTNIDQELEHWDENAEDEWDEEEAATVNGKVDGKKVGVYDVEDNTVKVDAKKRDD